MDSLKDIVMRVTNLGADFIRDGVTYQTVQRACMDNKTNILLRVVQKYLQPNDIVADITLAVGSELNILHGTAVVVNDWSMRGARVKLAHIREIHLPDTMKCIPEDTFRTFHITHCTLPNSIIHIGKGLLYYCKELESCVLPENITILPYATFSGCRRLSQLKLPHKLQQIQNTACCGTAISEITIPPSVQTIETYAFTSNPQLHTVHLNMGLQKIGDGAFSKNNALQEFTIPRSVTWVDPAILRGCENLRVVHLPKHLADRFRLTGLPQSCQIVTY